MEQDKAALRRHFRRARAALTPVQRGRAERQTNRVLKRFIKRGKRIGVYWAVGSELRLDGFIRAARQRRASLYLPYLETGRRRMWFSPYPKQAKPERGSKRRPNIPQFGGRKIRADRLHLMILPLLAADRHGGRLGQGGGYYDATLAALRGRLRPYLLGVGFACQLSAQPLPMAAYDQRTDGFVCEKGFYAAKDRR